MKTENNEIRLLETAYNALSDKKAIDITILDIRGLSVMSDFFIIASAKNNNQLLAMKDETEEKLREEGVKEIRVEGNRNSSWVLLDCKDIIIHLFSEEDRLFYDLERIWQDGKKIDISELKQI